MRAASLIEKSIREFPFPSCRLVGSLPSEGGLTRLTLT